MSLKLTFPLAKARFFLNWKLNLPSSNANILLSGPLFVFCLDFEQSKTYLVFFVRFGGDATGRSTFCT